MGLMDLLSKRVTFFPSHEVQKLYLLLGKSNDSNHHNMKSEEERSCNLRRATLALL